VRTLRPPCRFPPQHRILLSPESLVAALPMQLLHRVGFDYSPGGRAQSAALRFVHGISANPAGASPERQEDEQPPHEHSPGESRKRRILGKGADVATNTAVAAIEILTSLLPW
jgi:hypothetical protein